MDNDGHNFSIQFNSKMTDLKLFIFTNAISLLIANTDTCNNFAIQNIVCLTYKAIYSQLYIVQWPVPYWWDRRRISTASTACKESKDNIPVQEWSCFYLPYSAIIQKKILWNVINSELLKCKWTPFTQLIFTATFISTKIVVRRICFKSEYRNWDSHGS